MVIANMNNMAAELALWTGQSIRETMALIDRSNVGAIVFIDDDRRVAGLVTDGDIRRAIINGAELSDPVSGAWTPSPQSVTRKATVAERFTLMKQLNIRHLVVLDDDGLFADLQTFAEVEEQFEINPQRCPVVLMAGGRGTRLMPLTADCPKPMLRLGDKPLLERTVSQLAAQGFETFYISVNYLSEKIIEYFGDGERFGVRIEYLREDKPTGTGGCLKLLPRLDAEHFIMLNGDLVTDLDFRGLVAFHNAQKFSATMVVREYASKLDYGVVRVDGPRFLRVEEKPTHHYFINSGIYALRASVLDSLPDGHRFDMPDVFNALVSDKKTCGVLEHKGEWIDVGTPRQLEAARSRFKDGGPSQQ